MARLVWTDPALTDLRDIIAYIRKDSPTYSRRMGERLRAAPKALKTNPRRGWMVAEFERDDLRELLVSSYRIIYRIEDETCSIIAIAHGSRDLTRLLGPAD